MKRVSIPVLRTGNNDIDRFGEVVKQNLDSITGQQQNIARLSPLPGTATTADIIERLNVLLERIQGT
jgi:hypothetical protein